MSQCTSKELRPLHKHVSQRSAPQSKFLEVIQISNTNMTTPEHGVNTNPKPKFPTKKEEEWHASHGWSNWGSWLA